MLQSDGFGPAYRDLARREPVFARLITVYGRPDPFEWPDGGRTGSSQFAAMLLHIVGQQISAVAAFAIYDRISAATGGIPASAGVLGLGQDRLRACGLSAARARYALALAEAQTTEAIDIEHLDALGDSDATRPAAAKTDITDKMIPNRAFSRSHGSLTTPDAAPLPAGWRVQRRGSPVWGSTSLDGVGSGGRSKTRRVCQTGLLDRAPSMACRPSFPSRGVPHAYDRSCVPHRVQEHGQRLVRPGLLGHPARPG